ncbi:MAG: hypothetical protein MJ180_00655 [Candidatus Gastranaerophilales bacterium]|nr:hypothetical protein [Candidatus Gastranaerophilales bacterium]
MKKTNLFLAGFVCAVLAITPAFCEDNIFGDLTTTPPSTSELQTTVKVDEPVAIRGTSQMSKQETLTTQSLQNTVSSLEAAQADLRTKLETAQTNYNSVDQEYKRVKQERAALKKIVKKTNSRIKSLERTKTKVQKTMQTD